MIFIMIMIAVLHAKKVKVIVKPSDCQCHTTRLLHQRK